MGFVLQLVGYAVDFDAPWLLLYAVGAITFATVSGIFGALVRKALERSATARAQGGLEDCTRT
jgi:hypothetical protein